MPLQNMGLWYIGYFVLRVLEKQQIQGETFSELLSLILQKELKRHKSSHQEFHQPG